MSILTHDVDIIQMAHVIKEQGFTPIPLLPKSKIPSQGKDWNNQPCNFSKLTNNHNLGVAGVLDIDLDSEPARRMAMHFFPKCGLIYGRKGEPTHLQYKLPKKAKYKYTKFADKEECLLEYRPLSGKHQSMIFPSMHPDGDKLQLIKGEGWFEVDEDQVYQAACRVSAIGLLGKHWAEGSRQDAIMALTGGLKYAGFEDREVVEFTEWVLELGHDMEEVEMRRTGISGTLEKFSRGERVTGFTTLAEIIGQDVIGTIKKWLNVTGSEHKSGEILMQDGLTWMVKLSAKGVPSMEKICSFEMKPKSSIEVEGSGEHLVIDFITADRSYEIEVNPNVWVSAQRFKQFLADKGNVSLGYLGGDAQLQALKVHLYGMMGEIPRKKGVRAVGMHGDMFVCHDGALTSEGFRNDVVVINEYKIDTKILDAEPMTNFSKIRDLIAEFNQPIITHAALGWAVACFYKSELHKFKDIPGFPMLMHEGVAGSGKTQTAELIAEIFSMSTQFPSIANITPFIMQVGPGASNCMPIIYEEYKPNRMNQRKQNDISGLGRDTYTMASAQKGTKNLGHIDYPRTAPILICGESGFSEIALLERTIQCSFGRQTSFKHAESFQELRKCDLNGLGRAILKKRLATSVERIKEVYDEEYAAVDPRLQTRVRNNAAIARLGLRFLGELVGKEFDPVWVDMSLMHSTVEDPTQCKQKTEIGKILETMGRMASATGYGETTFVYGDLALIEGVHYKTIKEGKELGLHLETCYDLFRAWAKKYSYDGDIPDLATFRKQLRSEPYFLDRRTVKMNAGIRKCGILDLKLMENEGIELGLSTENT